MAEETTELANISRANQMLEEAKTILETINVRDMAVASYAWATARGADKVAQAALEVKLRSERKAGQFLVDMKKEGILGDGKFKTVGHDVPPQSQLKDWNILPQESKRWQRIALLPEARFEECIAVAKDRTQSALLDAAKQLTSQDRKAEKLDRAVKRLQAPFGMNDSAR